MARLLDSSYFTLLERRVVGDYEYQSYAVLEAYAGTTLVLFSDADPAQPLAALSFVSAAGFANALVTNRRDPPQQFADKNYQCFHALTSVDNADYAFVITNLTDFVRQPTLLFTDDADKTQIGMLKIDVLGEDVDVDRTDMPQALNAINELFPSQSYLVKSDQRTGNYTMKLRGAVDAHSGAALTVGNDEAAATALGVACKGTYVHVNVSAPSTFPEMVALLEKRTTWKCTEVFTRRIAKANGRVVRNRYDMFSFGGGEMPLRGTSSFGYGGFGGGAPGGAPSGGPSIQSRGGITSPSPPFTFGVGAAGFIPNSELEIHPQSECVDTNNDDQVLSAQAGTSIKGDRRIDVRVVDTNLTYVHAKRGARAVIALAIWRDLFLYDTLPRSQAAAEAKLQLDALIERADQDVLNNLDVVFEQAECSVCMDAPPTIVVLRCAHKCLCAACRDELKRQDKLKQCVLCRQRVAGTISAATLEAL